MDDNLSSESATTKNNVSKAVDGNDSIKGKSDPFDIRKLNEHLKLCLRASDGEVDLDEYICIFQQLYKFFCILGTVFGFVGTDVKTKTEILKKYRTSESRAEYETVEKMVAYEKTNGLILSNKDTSGSRTLLRLHRSLIFVSQFLQKTMALDDNEGTSHVCKEAYNATMAKFHPWLIQKGATLAMYTLPTKKDLVKRVADGKLYSGSSIDEIIQQVIVATEQVYNQCEKIYGDHDVLNLP